MFNFFKKKKTELPAKDAKPAKAKSASAKKPVTKDVKTPSADDKALDKTPAKAAPTSLKEALAAMEEAIPGSAEAKPAQKISAGANLDKAKEALAKKAAGGPMDREALIKQALAIQQTQAKMLDKLPEATRNKLRDMAMKAFVLDEPKSKDQKKKMH